MMMMTTRMMMKGRLRYLQQQPYLRCFWPLLKVSPTIFSIYPRANSKEKVEMTLFKIIQLTLKPLVKWNERCVCGG